MKGRTRTKQSVACIVASAAIAVAGCATTSGGMANDCNVGAGRCEVTITVTEPCNNPGNIVAVPEHAETSTANATSRSLGSCRTTIDSAAATLSPSRATPMANSPMATSRVPLRALATRSTSGKTNDPGTSGRPYRYGMKFTGPNGTCSFDPFIRNG